MLDSCDVGASNWLRFVKDEILILTIQSHELLLKVQIEVGLHGIEEHNRILTWSLKHVIHDILRLEIVKLSRTQLEAMAQGQYLESTEE